MGGGLGLRASEANEVVENALDAAGFRAKPFQSLTVGTSGILFEKQIGVADHGGERVVELVSNPGDQLADARETLLLHELTLGALEALEVGLRFEQKPGALSIEQNLPEKHEHTHKQDAREGDGQAKQ